MASFKTRRVGKTALEVTELAFGAGSMSGNFVEVPDEQARATVGAALDAGINYIDVAPQYGLGRGEHLAGDALRDRRQGVVLSTKVGGLLRPYAGDEPRGTWVKPFPFQIVYDYTYDAIMRSYEDSLQRLAIAEIDVLYVHDLGEMTHGKQQNAVHWKNFWDGGGYRALQELKSSGRIKAIGLGVNEWQVLLDAMKLGDWDIFLLAGRYTLLEQTSLAFLGTCLERNVSVLAAAPFNGGALMGTGKWNYGDAPRDVIDRVAALEAFCKDHEVPIGAAALQFPCAHPAVVSVLVGPKSPAEVRANVDWWNVSIPGAFWDDLAEAKLVAPGTPLPNGKVA
jgi:D-threo-aldose 1-dehydrogenase